MTCPHLNLTLRQYLAWVRSLDPDHPCLYCIAALRTALEREEADAGQCKPV